jgi:LEA14-like dessication related protein
MKKLNYFFILFFALLLASCKNYKEVQCTGIKGFKINKVNTAGIDANIQLGIKNPNAMGFSIYPSEFDIFYNGTSLGKAKLSKRVHINATTEGVYDFNLNSDFKNGGLKDVMRLVGGMGNGMVEVKGNLKAGKFYLKKKFPIAVKERLSLN